MDVHRPEPRRLARVISPREMRLVFWLIVIALVGVIGVLGSGIADTLSGPAVILFVAWLMAYVLEPPVTWLARHMPFHSRGLAVAMTAPDRGPRDLWCAARRRGRPPQRSHQVR